MITTIGISIAVTLALNIGANNAGITMGPVYGAGIRSKFVSLLFVALFNILGAVVVGWRGVQTVGQGLFTTSLSSNPQVFLLVAPAVALSLMILANLLRVPVSTTHAAVASLVGIGLYFEIVHVSKALHVLLWWVLTPFVAITITFVVGKFLVWKAPNLLVTANLGPRTKRVLGWLLTLGGGYVAFTVGANNAANSAAVLFGGGILPAVWAALLAGAGMAVGALLWGGRVLETVAKGITELCHVRALVVAFVSGTITLVAALGGIPISNTLVVTSAVIGFSLATAGARATVDNTNVRRILAMWTASPILAVSFTYSFGALVR